MDWLRRVRDPGLTPYATTAPQVIPIGSSRASTLMRWLRTLDTDRLRRVLDARPDSTRAPEPRTLGELADRLQRPGSVVQALTRLPLPCLQVAEALAALPAPVARTELDRLLDADAGELEPVLHALADHALVWPGPTGEPHLAPALRRGWEAPLGLGPGLDELLPARSSEELRRIVRALGLAPGTTKQQRIDAVLDHHADADRLRALIDSAPPGARELLERGSAPPDQPLIMYSSSRTSDSAAERWLLERALLVGREWPPEPARVPAEVTRALRGPDWHAPFDPAPSDPPLVALTTADVEREATAAATAFAGQAAAVLAECAARPASALKSGGIGARQLLGRKRPSLLTRSSTPCRAPGCPLRRDGHG
ncbi:hypothetical protein ACFV9O_37150, partial [Streptomyces sp. NPDC059909]